MTRAAAAGLAILSVDSSSSYRSAPGFTSDDELALSLEHYLLLSRSSSIGRRAVEPSRDRIEEPAAATKARTGGQQQQQQQQQQQPAAPAAPRGRAATEEGQSSDFHQQLLTQSDILVLPRGAAAMSRSASENAPATVALSVLSFNVLADCYVRVPGQPWNAFVHVEDAHLDWEARRPQILALLRQSEADVICLQELVLERRGADGAEEEGEWGLPAWTAELAGYRGVLQGLKPKEWEKNAERNLRMVGRKVPTGVATFYREARLEECAPSKHGSGSGIALFLRRRRSAADPPCEVAVGNLHLVGDPAKFDVHLTALNGLKKNMAGWWEGKHRVICGDFNGECEEGSEVAKWISGNGFAEAPTGRSWASPGKALRLDHILFSPSSGLRVTAAGGEVSPEELRSGLPSGSCPSDHVPVAAVFALR